MGGEYPPPSRRDHTLYRTRTCDRRSRLFARVHVVVPRGRFFQSLISLSMDAETEPVAVQKEEEQVSSKEVVRNGCVLLVLRDH